MVSLDEWTSGSNVGGIIHLHLGDIFEGKFLSFDHPISCQYRQEILYFRLQSGTNLADNRKGMFYYRGMQQWLEIKGYLQNTSLTTQDRFKVLLGIIGWRSNKCMFKCKKLRE